MSMCRLSGNEPEWLRRYSQPPTASPLGLAGFYVHLAVSEASRAAIIEFAAPGVSMQNTYIFPLPISMLADRENSGLLWLLSEPMRRSKSLTR